MTSDRHYIDFIQSVVNADIKGLTEAQKSYNDSWKRRGGIGAFMMLARKWDRMAQQVSTEPKYDVFGHISADQRSDGIIDDIRDLRRYLILVEAEMIAREVVKP